MKVMTNNLKKLDQKIIQFLKKREEISKNEKVSELILELEKKMKKNRYGLLGRTLGHSYSKELHEQFSNYQYEYFEVEPEDLKDFLKEDSISGFNVTIPYKEKILPFLDHLSPEAREIGAVNTVVRKNGKLTGYNTDLYGFQKTLEKMNFNMKGQRVLILGDGGSAKTVRSFLEKEEPKALVNITRTGENTYEDLQKFHHYNYIINTTPVGMFPKTGEQLVDLKDFPYIKGVVDLVYNPLRTALILQAKELGIPAIGGLYMLVGQGVKAMEYFSGEKTLTLDEIYQFFLKQKENIVLVGMPGSGKSTIARKVGEKLNRKVIDTDHLIRERYGPINDIILKDLNRFRELESQIIREVGEKSGVIIATGGGAVLREENYAPLKQNGMIFFLERRTDRLSTRNRPISQRSNLNDLYQERLPKYQKFADRTLVNRNFKQIIYQMIEVFYEYSSD